MARFDAFVGKVQQESKPDNRNNLLAEARAAFYLVQNGFRIVEWEPLGEGGKTGEFRCMFRDSPAIFVEIKQPGWQGEWMPLNVAEKRRLSSEDKTRRLHRMSLTKFIPGKIESGAVRSHLTAMDVIRRNALPKLPGKSPNLVVAVDDAYCSRLGFRI